MAKLDWSRAKLRVFDPGRYLPSRDTFVTPDNPQPPKGKKAKSSFFPIALKKQLRAEAGITKQRAEKKAKENAEHRKRKAAKRAAKLERRRLAEAENRKKQAEANERRAEAKRLKEEKLLAHKAAVEARRAAFAEYQKTPEYAAKLEREAAKMAAMKKTHREVWAENQPGLNKDRTSLRQQWRAKLLGHRIPSQGPSPTD